MQSYEESIVDLNKSIEIDPHLRKGEGTYWRGQVYKALGKTAAAEIDEKAALAAGFELEQPD